MRKMPERLSVQVKEKTVVKTAGLYLGFILLSIAFLPATVQAVSFGSAVDFSAGTGPSDMDIDDINHDGNIDLAVANQDSDEVSILLGDGSGSFGTAVSFGAGTSPASVAIGDVNKDGNPDLAVANQGSDDVSVLLGDGSGSFGTAVSFGAGTSPASVAIGDLDGDGNPDLAVANQGSDDVSVLPGDGSGSFGTAVSFGAGTSPASVAIGDVNKDGRPDVSSANQGSDDVSLLVNNTLFDNDRTFAPAVNYTAATVPRAVAQADFNRDGNPDLAVAIGGGSVGVLLGDGLGGFADAVGYTAGSAPIFVASGDVNKDGQDDLAVANFSSNSVSILLGNGNGTFTAPTNLPIGGQPKGVVLGDLNKDGNPDLAVSNSGLRSISVMLGNGDGSFGSVAQFTVGDGYNSNPGSVALADFNNDGALDLVTNIFFDNTADVLLGNGDGTFQAAISYSTLVSYWGINPDFAATGDVNRDGKPDVVTANAYGDVSVLLGNGDGTFAAATRRPGTINVYYYSVDIADVNRDGKPDLAVSGTNGASVMLGNGAGGFGAPQIFSTGGYPYHLTFGDFDRDGYPDLAVPNSTSNTLSVLLNIPPPPEADLSITKSDGTSTEVPGTGVTYTIVVTNNGPDDMTGATVTDTLPAEAGGASWSCVASSGSSCTGSGTGDISDSVDLLSGGTATYTVTATIASSATGILSNTATVAVPTGNTETNPANNTATDTDTLTPQADLLITKDDGAATEIPGTGVTYTIVVTNSGPSDVTGATVTDSLPAALTGATWTCIASSGSSCAAGGTGNISDSVNLLVGGTATYTLNATVDPAAAGSLDNTAAVAVPGGVTETNPADNSATDSDTLAAAPTVTAEDANPGETSATLKATVTPNEAQTNAWCQWGLTASYGNTTTPEDVGSSGQTLLNVAISGLDADTIYHFRCVAQNAVGTTSGADGTFKTGLPGSACFSHAPAYIDSGLEYLSAQSACDAAIDNDLVMLWGGVLTEALDVMLASPSDTINLQGGWNCDFSGPDGSTVIDGTITLTTGAVIFDGITVR